MSRKRSIFDIEMPSAEVSGDVGVPDKFTQARRGPMASAINENAESLKARRRAEEEIRNENDRLAAELVRLKKAGLIVDRIPLDNIATSKLVRDRRPGADAELDELKTSIKEIGLSNPIHVEIREDGVFELIQGMRRLSAYRDLLAETGDEAYATIPAGIGSAESDLIGSYRRMVDENLVRKDVSFGEMANLAQRFAEDPSNNCDSTADAVSLLYKSANYTKRSYIRAFAELLMRLEKVLEFPYDIPRNVGVELKRRLDNDPRLLSQVVAALRSEPIRDAKREVEILRSFSTDVETLPTGKKTAANPSPKPRKAKTTFQVPLSGGMAKCNASPGRLELRRDMDFSAVDRHKLEQAVAAFFTALDD